MKKFIKLSAICLLLSSSLLAAPRPVIVHNMEGQKDHIVFNTLPSQRGIDLMIKKAEAGKTTVIIYDKDGNVLWKDVMNGRNGIRRGYVLNQLENGDYSIEISSKNQVFKRDIHIYDEGTIKTFVVKQV